MRGLNDYDLQVTQVEVFITGMHRSGTSMLARMLNLCGVYLGPEERLMTPKPDNPEGFWEHLDLTHVNNKLLAIADGAWDVVPECGDDLWCNDERLVRYRRRAREVIDQFREKADIVGVKDPRFCLTAPFWLRLFPDARIIVCFRNPFEVAQSLGDRNGLSELLSLKLWFEYNSKILEATALRQRLVTGYATFFESPEKELQRIVEWLGLAASKEAIQNASATVKSELRHHKDEELKTGDQFCPDRYEKVRTLYGRLVEESQCA